MLYTVLNVEAIQVVVNLRPFAVGQRRHPSVEDIIQLVISISIVCETINLVVPAGGGSMVRWW
jgi:hypothetical protein